MKKDISSNWIWFRIWYLYPVLKELQNSKNFDLKIVVTGAHLSDWHGFTLEKIEEDGFEIVEKIDYLLMTNRKLKDPKE